MARDNEPRRISEPIAEETSDRTVSFSRWETQLSHEEAQALLQWMSEPTAFPTRPVRRLPER